MAWILLWSLARLGPATCAGNVAMRVSAATGPIEIKANLMEEWIAVEAGELLLSGDLVRTRVESSAQVTCPDGSQLKLAPETTLDVRRVAFESDTRVLTLEMVLWQGRVTLRSQPLNPVSTQLLRTPDLAIEPAAQGAWVELAYTKTAGTTVAVLDQAVTLFHNGVSSLLRVGQSFPSSKQDPQTEEGTKSPPVGPAAEPRESPPGQASPESAEPSVPFLREEPPSERRAPGGVPQAIWNLMSEAERQDLETRLPTMTEGQRETLRQMTVAQWQAARSVARTLVCQTHLQQIGAAFMRYAQDHAGTLPPVRGWQRAIYPYLESEASWDCPEEGHENSFDYLYNPQLAGVRLSDLRQPRLTVLVFEGTPRDDHVSGGESALAPRHEGAVNVLFADGQVRSMTLPLYRNVRWQP